MKELELLLMLRHNRVLPKLFMLLERLGADCLDVQGQLHPGTGGRVKLIVACPPALVSRVKTQIERLVDVSELRDCGEVNMAHAQTFRDAAASPGLWGGNGL